jgi:hypothetical protein
LWLLEETVVRVRDFEPDQDTAAYQCVAEWRGEAEALETAAIADEDSLQHRQERIRHFTAPQASKQLTQELRELVID